MIGTDNLRYTKLGLGNGSGAIPALGFGTLIPDPVATRNATKVALEAGFRALDTAERYRSRGQTGDWFGSDAASVATALQLTGKAETLKRSETKADTLKC